MIEPSQPPTFSPQRPTHVRFVVLGLVAFAAASAYLTRLCFSAAITSIQSDLKIDSRQIGIVLGAFSLGYLLFQVPGGWLGQRFGTRGAFAASSVVWSLLTIWTALARTFSELVVSRFAFGLAQAGLAPLAGQVLKDWVPTRRRGMSSAMISASMSVGGAATLFLTGLLLKDDGLSWRTIFILWSFVGIAWAAAFMLLFRTRPEQHPWVNAAEVDVIREGSAAASPATLRESDAGRGTNSAVEPNPSDAERSRVQILAAMATSIALWALCIQSFFRAAGYDFYAYWLFAYLEFAWKTPQDVAGRLAFLSLVANVAGALSGGVLVDLIDRKAGSRWLSRSGTAAGALGLCTLLTWYSAHATSATQLAVVMALGAYFAGIASPAIWAATIDVGGAQTGVTVGVMNMAGCLAGVVVSPYVGRMIDGIKASGGAWNQVILLHVAIYAAAAVACLLIRPDRPVA